MRPDRLHVAVRPRGILECLDIAALFCGRRPLVVLGAAVLGALPCILLNRMLFAGARDTAVLPLFWLLAMEVPWAATPLVLALGQAVFSDRISWRLAGRSLVGALPALIVFQVLLRGVCLATVVLVPLIAVGWYFLDPIILLERPPLARIWSRRTAMNRWNLGHLVGLASVDIVVLLTGWALGGAFLDAGVAAWNGFAPEVPDETGGAMQLFISWQSQIAFWAANAFLVVFRFFAYLNARIRREGWDVELKFRSAATYAGLDGAAVRTAALAALVAVASVAAARAAPAAEPTADGAAAARAALEQQGFPWYDAAADDFRPLVERPAAPKPQSTPAPEMEGMPGLGLDLVVQLVAVLAGVALVAWLIVRFGLPERPPPRLEDDVPIAVVLDSEQLEALPEVVRQHDGDPLAEAAARAERGDFAGAMIFFHAWLLLQFHARGLLELARGKTNGRYVDEISSAAPGAAPGFARSTRLFEDAFFGHLAVAASDFHAVWERRGGLADLEPARD